MVSRIWLVAVLIGCGSDPELPAADRAMLADGISSITHDSAAIEQIERTFSPNFAYTPVGPDADVFNPHRVVPDGIPPWGLSFGTGVHTCLGRDLDGGMQARADTDPATHQYGIVPLLVMALFERNARPDPAHPPTRSSQTERPNWGGYPILFDT